MTYFSLTSLNKTTAMSDRMDISIETPPNDTTHENSSITPTQNEVDMASDPVSSPAPTNTHSYKTYFCAVCNIEIRDSNRGRHMMSQTHQRAAGVKKPKRLVPICFCNACNVVVVSNNWAAHTKRESHQTAVEASVLSEADVKLRWCVPCAVSMQPSDWQLHCRSAEHTEASNKDNSDSDQAMEFTQPDTTDNADSDSDQVMEDAPELPEDDDTDNDSDAEKTYKQILAESTNPVRGKELMCDSCKRPVRVNIWLSHQKTIEHIANLASAEQDELTQESPKSAAPTNSAAISSTSRKDIGDKGGISKPSKEAKPARVPRGGPFTEEEDELILRAYILEMLEDGDIAKRLEGRTKFAVTERRRVLMTPKRTDGVWEQSELYLRVMAESYKKA